MNCENGVSPQSDSIFSKALQTIQNPLYDCESQDYNVIIPVIKSIDFFCNNLRPYGRLQDFIQEAKYHFKYEAHEFGTVLTNEDFKSDNLYIILEGTVRKLRQRSNQEIEQEAKEKNSDSFSIDTSMTDSQIMSPNRNTVRRRSSSRSSIEEVQKIMSSNRPVAKSTFNPERSNQKTIENSQKIGSDRMASSPLNIDVPSPTIVRRGSCDVQPVQENLKIHHTRMLSNPLRAVPKLSKLEIPLINAERTVTQGEILNFNSIYDLISNIEVKSCRASSRGLTKLKDEPVSANKIQSVDDTNSFIAELVSKNPDVEKKLLLRGVSRVISVKTLKAGDYFGETFSQHRFKENSTIVVSSKEACFLTITKKSYNEILAKLDQIADNKYQALATRLNHANDEDLHRFSQYFYQRMFKKGQTIYKQRESANELYILGSGRVKLEASKIKPREEKTSKKTFTNLTREVIKGEIFGREFILYEKYRSDTASVESIDANVYILDSFSYDKATQNFPDLIKTLYNQSREAVESGSKDYQESLRNKPKPMDQVNAISNSEIMSTTPLMIKPTKSWGEIRTSRNKESKEILATNEKINEMIKANAETVKQHASTNDNIVIYRDNFSRKSLISFDMSKKIFDSQNINEEMLRSTQSPVSDRKITHFTFTKGINSPAEGKSKLPKIPSNLNSPKRKDSELSTSAAILISKLGSSPGFQLSKTFDQTKSPFSISSPPKYQKFGLSSVRRGDSVERR